MRNKVNELMEKFNCDGEVVYIGLFNSGHINTTCLVVVEDNGKLKKYVFQRINTNVFKRITWYFILTYKIKIFIQSIDDRFVHKIIISK